LEERIWPLLPKRDRIVPVIDSVYPFERVADAHARLETSAHIGKIVLTW
jgi:NADPH2:quinone reductase